MLIFLTLYFFQNKINTTFLFIYYYEGFLLTKSILSFGFIHLDIYSNIIRPIKLFKQIATVLYIFAVIILVFIKIRFIKLNYK